MDRLEFIEFLLDHYENPRNYGALEGADVVIPGGNPDCDDQVTIYLKVDPTDQLVEKMTFEGQGCAISQATASLLSEMVEGATLAEVDAMNISDLITMLGREVVQSRPRCATLALQTLKTAIAHYRSERSIKE